MNMRYLINIWLQALILATFAMFGWGFFIGGLDVACGTAIGGAIGITISYVIIVAFYKHLEVKYE